MRKTFDTYLTELAKKDDKIYLLTADMGSFNAFKSSFPDRFINMGIAEPNMVSVAAGLALEGNKPFIYAVAGFCMHRGFEQLKFNVCYKNLPVTIINAASGLCYNRCGAGHYLVDDFSLMRTLPKITVTAPVDVREFKMILDKAYSRNMPYYIRTGIDNCPEINFEQYPYIYYKDEKRSTIVTTGFCSQIASRICKDLPVNVLHVLTLNRSSLILDIDLKHVNKIMVIEDHIKFGGLGSSISKPFEHFCLPDIVDKTAETHEELLKIYGFDDKTLYKKIKLWLNK